MTYCPCKGQAVVNTSGMLSSVKFVSLKQSIPPSLSVVLEIYTENPRKEVPEMIFLSAAYKTMLKNGTQYIDLYQTNKQDNNTRLNALICIDFKQILYICIDKLLHLNKLCCKSSTFPEMYF